MVRCAQRMLTARNRRHIPACIRRLFGLDDAVDDKAFGELVAQARAPRADAPKGLIVQAQRCVALRLFAIAVSDDALMLRSRRNPRTADHYERRCGDYPRGTDRGAYFARPPEVLWSAACSQPQWLEPVRSA